MRSEISKPLHDALKAIDAALAAESQEREDGGKVSVSTLISIRFEEFNAMSETFPNSWKRRVAAMILKATGVVVQEASVGTLMSRERKRRRAVTFDPASAQPNAVQGGRKGPNAPPTETEQTSGDMRPATPHRPAQPHVLMNGPEPIEASGQDWSTTAAGAAEAPAVATHLEPIAGTEPEIQRTADLAGEAEGGASGQQSLQEGDLDEATPSRLK